ncbi:MAG: SPW repeat protein [Chloroflexi bacterium]|nr:SPW repeat protein [Ktedonobacteraceae bacterium]MBV8821326.1 SPW repeat protein [Ktedonobacteraceae bacterium]MBV9020352.1 SPW repeat protein [Ktedonobacteraceae bacterium]MBV9708016.1 SPW repeat protein [Chloroflexota bacterium]
MGGLRFIPTSVHGVLDYLVGIALILAPWLFSFAYVGGIAVYLPIILGAGLILYSLLTKYELGIPGIKFIPMPYHLVIDFIAAALLAVSPFLFGFSSKPLNVWLPHLVVGVVVILVVLVSQTQPKAAVQAV